VPYQCINELVNRRRGVTPSTALRLARSLDTSPGYWLNLQACWDLYHAQRAEEEALAAITPIEATT
jgi:addiction module HigA family antidote